MLKKMYFNITYSKKIKSNCILNPLENKSLADFPRSAYDGGEDILHKQH